MNTWKKSTEVIPHDDLLLGNGYKLCQNLEIAVDVGNSREIFVSRIIMEQALSGKITVEVGNSIENFCVPHHANV
jgi:hypothetical protein